MAGYIGTIPVPQATQTRETFTATANQTSFATGGYTPNFIDVFMNGVKLAPADFTATNGSDVVLASGAAANDIIDIVAFTAFQVLNQNFTGNTSTQDLTVSGNLTVTGSTITIDTATVQNVDLGDNDKIRLGDGDDLQIYHDGSNSYVDDTGTGRLYLRGNDRVQIQKYTGEDMITAIADGAVNIYYDNSKKFETTSTGVVVTGIAGIGTSSPVANTALTLQSPSGYTDTLQLKSVGTNIDSRINITPTGTGTAQINNTAGTGIDFQISGADKMIIDSSGNVGIGHVSPTAILDVRRGDASGKIAEFHTSTGFGIELGSSQSDAYVQSGSSQALLFNTNGSNERMRINSNGNVGIGTSSPANKFIVAEGTNQHGVEIVPGTLSYIQAYDRAVMDYGDLRIDAQTIRFATDNGSERMRIDTSGNVGIGTTNPTQKLRVEGNIQSTGQYYAGSAGAATPDYSFAADTSLGMFRIPGALGFATGGAERMRIDSSGNLGIGTSSPAQLLHVQAGSTGNGVIRVGGGSGLEISHDNSGNTTQRIDSLYRTTSNSTNLQLRTGTFTIHTGTSGTEHLKVDASGHITNQYGNTGGYAQSSGSGGTAIVKDTGSVGGTIIQVNNAARGWSNFYVNKIHTSGQDTRFFQFTVNGSGACGYIRLASASTMTYGTSSDYRLKENVVYDWDATTRLKQLKPARFNFILDGTDVTQEGFMAHEAQEVVPIAVSGTKDGMKDEEYEITPAVVDDDGVETKAAVMGTRSVIDGQGIDHSMLVPLLVKTIQELEARITALEAG